MGNWLKITNPVVKLAGHRVRNDGVEKLDGNHDEANQSDQEPPG